MKLANNDLFIGLFYGNLTNKGNWKASNNGLDNRHL